ncbi:unnamed protein product [Amoebophrya sp. A120]|nr:unnamed protein product [Amoebophrya sp. A120]|eukprot:GSA120T00024450001.1
MPRRAMDRKESPVVPPRRREESRERRSTSSSRSYSCSLGSQDADMRDVIDEHEEQAQPAGPRDEQGRTANGGSQWDSFQNDFHRMQRRQEKNQKQQVMDDLSTLIDAICDALSPQQGKSTPFFRPAVVQAWCLKDLRESGPTRTKCCSSNAKRSAGSLEAEKLLLAVSGALEKFRDHETVTDDVAEAAVAAIFREIWPWEDEEQVESKKKKQKLSSAKRSRKLRDKLYQQCRFEYDNQRIHHLRAGRRGWATGNKASSGNKWKASKSGQHLRGAKYEVRKDNDKRKDRPDAKNKQQGQQLPARLRPPQETNGFEKYQNQQSKDMAFYLRWKVQEELERAPPFEDDGLDCSAWVLIDLVYDLFNEVGEERNPSRIQHLCDNSVDITHGAGQRFEMCERDGLNFVRVVDTAEETKQKLWKQKHFRELERRKWEKNNPDDQEWMRTHVLPGEPDMVKWRQFKEHYELKRWKSLAEEGTCTSALHPGALSRDERERLADRAARGEKLSKPERDRLLAPGVVQPRPFAHPLFDSNKSEQEDVLHDRENNEKMAHEQSERRQRGKQTGEVGSSMSAHARPTAQPSSSSRSPPAHAHEALSSSSSFCTKDSTFRRSDNRSSEGSTFSPAASSAGNTSRGSGNSNYSSRSIVPRVLPENYDPRYDVNALD